MEFIFLNAAGTTLFTRTDMESGHWIQQEMSVNADFPFVPGKVITQGMRIAFHDPATDVIQVFEIRNVKNTEPDHFQQITAEHIAISELQDEHIDTTEIDGKTAAQALTTALTGTLWSVGNNTASGTNNADLSRGSVWNAVIAIQQAWNVYIIPRVTISSAGVITGRYLDITPAQGTWRGVRLSVRKNLLDPVVTYDDSEVLTALYGYGGNVTVTHTGEDDTQEELTFADVVWTATADHPAKPSGQTYLEWAEKTALYGRNGRARFGYYQNSDITDAEVLLQKTWETLKTTCEPKISIAGTCVDLYRLGYKDEPLRLHDIAIVEIEETGEVFKKEITMLDTDLVDPTGSRPEIGDYMPSIVYIERDTTEIAENGTTVAGGGGGGGSRGGGGRGGKTNLAEDLSETFTEFIKTNDRIGMVIGTRNGDAYIKAGQIVLAINKSGETGQYESTALINANHVNISSTNTAHLLSGSIVYDEQGNLILKESTGGGVYVEHNDQGTTARFGVWDRGNLTGGVMVQQINGQTDTLITGDKINISGTNTVQSLAGAMELDASGNLIIKNGAGFKLEKTSGGSTAQYGVWDQGNLTAGVIATIVNGVSSTYISGDKIYIGNQDATTVINGKLNASDVTATYIQGKISDITILLANALSVAGGINGSGTLTVAGLTTLNGSLKFGSGNSFSNCIVSADITTIPGTLRLIDAAGNVTDFSKATSLSGSWSGTTYTVTASPQGNTNSTTIVLDLYGSANIIGTNVKNGNTVLDSKGAQLVESVSDKKVYCNLTGGSGSTIAQISTSDTYNAGFNAGEPTAVTIGSKITGTVYNVSVARGSYSAKALTVDAASVYSEGKTAGATSLTISGAASTNSTDYLLIDNAKCKVTATTTKGDGTSYTKSYVVEAKHDIGIRQSGSGDTMTVTAACQPSGHAPDAASASRSYTLTYSNGQAHIMYNGTSYADLTCGSGGSYTKYYGPNGETTFTMYYMRNGSYLSAGSKNWYYKS